MLKWMLFLAFWVTNICLFAQAPANQPDYSRVRVFFGENSLEDLARLGLEVDHGIFRKGAYIENDFSAREINLIKNAGFKYEILIDDVQAYYQSPHAFANIQSRGNNCATEIDINHWKTPDQYSGGSMGGYLTLSELYVVLDTMAARYPNLITARMPIDTFLTQEGRPIYYLKVSNHPNMDENEPKILYTALHHAREPNSLSQMVFYLWYLLENYETDAEIKNIVDNVELFFIPCINPDGYVFNETTNPDGGGLWRKNRWVEADTTFGVDLNRNYDFHWGYDDTGSSPNKESQTFRGPSAASEPEIKAVNFLANQFNFEIALNYHTYGNLLIHPWGYSDMNTADHATFLALGGIMIKENNFLLGTGTSTVGYTVNGDSDDWMYGAKNIFSMTPEVGPGFWPDPANIEYLNKLALHQNITAAQLLLNYVQAKITDISLTPNSGALNVEIAHAGLHQGASTVSLTSLEADFNILTPAYTVNLQHLDTLVKSFDYTASNIADGQIIKFVLLVQNDVIENRDTIELAYWSNDLIAFSETGEHLDTWSGEWATTTESFHTADKSITDSPNENYPSSAETLTMTPELDLTNVLGAELTFFAKWDIEANYDFAQIMATKDNGLTFQPLCGLWTKSGTNDQDENQPLYDGTQNSWVQEIIDLQDFVGSKVKIAFRMVSDNYVEKDGFYFDDLKLVTHLTPNANTNIQESLSLNLFPLPVDDILHIQLSQNITNDCNVLIYNNLGILIKNTKLSKGSTDANLNVSSLPSGVYFLKVDMGSRQWFEKFVKE